MQSGIVATGGGHRAAAGIGTAVLALSLSQAPALGQALTCYTPADGPADWEVCDLGTLGSAGGSALAANQDGRVIVGWGVNANGIRRAFRWVQGGAQGLPSNPQMQDLGSLRGTATGFSEAYGVSADGSVVVGQASTPDDRTRAFRWDATGTQGVSGNPRMQDLGTLRGATLAYSGASGVTADGTVVVGWSDTAGPRLPFRWVQGGTQGVVGNRQMQSLGALSGTSNTSSGAVAVNPAGTVIVGQSRTASVAARAFRWVAGGTQGSPSNPQMQDLGTLFAASNALSYGRAVSADGSVVVGSSVTGTGTPFQRRAFRWVAGGTQGVPSNPQMQQLNLDVISTFDGYAEGVSGDGSIVVGWADAEDRRRAFRWVATGATSGQAYELGAPPGFDYAVAQGISADGRVIVGQVCRPDDEEGRVCLAVLWRARTEFIGGGVVFNLSAACTPAGWGAGPHPVRLRYGPGEVNGMPSQVAILWPSGSEHLQVWQPLGPTTANFEGLGRQMWSFFVLQSNRPRVTPVQRVLLRPSGVTDAANATEVMMRLRVANFGGVTGCGATVAGVLRRPG